jgi:O-antigen ligase
MFFVWRFVVARSQKSYFANKEQTVSHLVLGLMISWLFWIADSATSLVCLAVGSSVIMGFRILRDNYVSIGRYVAITCVIVMSVMAIPEAPASLFQLLGRDVTLTGRTNIWSQVLEVEINPLVGTGYESFWMGERVAWFWEKYAFKITQSHNGYIEIYLNLGVIGLLLFGGIIVSTYRSIGRQLGPCCDLSTFRLAVLITFVLSNITEAGIKSTSLMWFLFLLIALEFPISQERKVAGPAIPQR